MEPDKNEEQNQQTYNNQVRILFLTQNYQGNSYNYSGNQGKYKKEVTFSIKQGYYQGKNQNSKYYQGGDYQGGNQQFSNQEGGYKGPKKLNYKPNYGEYKQYKVINLFKIQYNLK